MRKIPTEELIADLQRVAREQKTDKMSLALYQKHGKYAWHTFNARFGGWGKAQIAAGLKAHFIRKSYYYKRENISLSLRNLIMKRDRYKCCLCGATPATDPFIDFQIDHIDPVAEGGKTEPENLWLLCYKCNQAKSDLQNIYIKLAAKIHLNECEKFAALYEKAKRVPFSKSEHIEKIIAQIKRKNKL